MPTADILPNSKGLREMKTEYLKLKTAALTKSTSMGIWVVGTSNQLFIKGS